MKYITAILLIAVVAFSGCAAQQPADEQPGEISVDIGPSETEVKTFQILLTTGHFIPDSIEVDKGDTVRLLIRSIDADHDIAIPDFGVNELLPEGAEVEIEFVADKKGEFPFHCSLMCAGFEDLSGTIIVN
ncbi:cupredoxin domain-containing protein [Candidatus Woesearchaeota archaeon]|nr:cupredoxin domain-containing protein [Candidatus Woesearchaeota archaeon]